jgi:hypothetical protein
VVTGARRACFAAANGRDVRLERRMKTAHYLAAGLVFFVAMQSAPPASAADLGVVLPRRAVVAVPVRPVVVLPVLPHIWLGHFTGGARTAIPGVMDWRDEFARFESRGACLRWQRTLRAAYHSQEGFKTCLPIR